MHDVRRCLVTCPYCSKAESSPIKSVAPFCTELHRTAHTRGRARALEELKLRSCAGKGDRAEFDGLVHVVKSVNTTAKNNRFHYLEFSTGWYTLCGLSYTTYPKKTGQALTCMTCLCKL